MTTLSDTFLPTNKDWSECTWRHQLRANTSCYQGEDGTFFLFNEVPPYALSAVANGRRIDAELPTLKEPLTCAGVHENALYFYTTPPRRRSFTFYRASVTEGQDTIEFRKVTEVKNGDETLYFAHQQPFFVYEKDGQWLLYEFDGEGSKVAKFNPRETFFKHCNIIYRLRKGNEISVEKDCFYKSFTVVVTVPDPLNAAVYSSRDTEVLYVITDMNLLVIIDHALVKTIRFQPQLTRTVDGTSPQSIIGVQNALIIFSASDNSTIRNVWSAELMEQCCDRKAYFNLSPHFPSFIPSKGLTAKRNKNLSNLSIILPKGSQIVSKPIPKTRTKDAENSSSSCDSAQKSSESSSQRKIVKAASSAPLKPPCTLPSRPNSKVSQNSQKSKPLSDVIANLQLSSGGTSFDSKFLEEFMPLKVLGQGTFGCVFEVERKFDVTWKRAVKRIALKGSQKNVNDALKEVVAMESFKHPGIVQFHDAWKEQPPIGWQRWADDVLLNELGYKEHIPYPNDCSFLYIQMELCQSTLSNWIAVNKVRDLKKIKPMFRQIVSAVGYIHGNGKIHRDLKPNNILMTIDGVPKICDLGIVADCLIESGVEKVKSRTFGQGTGMYMAPEQPCGPYSSKVDVFALGLILTQLCVVMTMGKAMEVFDDYRTGNPNNVLDNKPEVKSLVALMTNVKDSDRPTCDEVLKHAFLK